MEYNQLQSTMYNQLPDCLMIVLGFAAQYYSWLSSSIVEIPEIPINQPVYGMTDGWTLLVWAG